MSKWMLRLEKPDRRTSGKRRLIDLEKEDRFVGVREEVADLDERNIPKEKK